MSQNKKATKFVRGLSQQKRNAHTQQFIQVVANFFDNPSKKKIMIIIKNYLENQQFNQIINNQNSISNNQKYLFSKMQNLILKNIKSPLTARNVLQVFSQSNPLLISKNKLQNFNKLSSKYQNQINIQSSIIKSSMIRDAMTKSFQKQSNKQIDIFGNNSHTDSINNLGVKCPKKSDDISMQNLLRSKNNQKRKSKLKILIKKQVQQTQFNASQQNLLNIQKKIFKNKKMMTDFIIFKRVQSQQNKKYQNFGQNWVYAYGLPYQYSQQQVQKLIDFLSKKYGQIVQYRLDVYKDFIQRQHKNQVFMIPFDYYQDNKKQRVRIQKVVIDQKQSQNQSNVKRSLASRILQKSFKQKQTALNKSTLLFKFKSKESKENFLTPQMRLYGLNYGKNHNIRFQQANQKKFVTLSSLPWGSQSCQLIGLINEALKSLKITVTYPNVIIAKGYAFIQFSNFYQAFHACQLLHNLLFEDHRIKACLNYGALQKQQGKYVNSFQINHYEQLVQKLSDLRQQYTLKNFSNQKLL